MIRTLSIQSLMVSRGERVLFRDLDLTLTAGEACALTGANGAGKTSLLRAIAGLLRPDAGEVHFESPAGAAVETTEARSHGLHLMGHLDGLKGGRRAGDELAFQARWLGADADALARAVDRLALAPLLDLPVRTLSAGQRRRLALARLIAAPRPLWLLDEPFAPLDADWRRRLGELMAEHLNDGGVILAAVHDPLPVSARALDLGAFGPERAA